MSLFETAIDSCAAEVKRGGIFGKKYNVSLRIYETKISGEAFSLFESGLLHSRFDVPYECICEANIAKVEDEECLVVEYKAGFWVSNSYTKKIAFLGLVEPEKWINLIKEMREKRTMYLYEKQEEERKEQKRKEDEKIQYEKNAEKYYLDCYSFHIQDETPTYAFSTGKNEIVALFIGKDKSLNFLRINGYSKEESVGTIPFEKIHYYEKAGNVSYTTDIHGAYSSYGGSFTGGHYSKLAAAVGGALFGFMGMTAGALFTYKPAQQTASNTSFSLDSEVIKIDDRNVILNFYSDVKKQYVDIELPQDIYNFLQTYLPEKKYGIVEELEKRAAIHQAVGAIQSGAVLNPGVNDMVAKLPEKQEGNIDVFKMKVEKLMMMKEAGLLSDQEFENERKKLLELI